MLLVVLALVVAAHVAHKPLSHDGSFTPWTFLGNVFMLQGIDGVGGWDGPSWSITFEGLAYLCFPLVAYAVLKVRGARTAALTTIVWLGAGTAVILALQGTWWQSISTPIALARIVVDFVAGALIWKMWSALGSPRSAWGDTATALAVVATLPLLWWAQTERWQLVAIPLMALFVGGVAFAGGPVRRVLSTRPMIWGGKVSYSLYMVHVVVIMVVGKMLPWSAHPHDALPIRIGILGGYFAACLAAAAVSYHFVEEPARRWLKRRWAN
jgi:peptidoglycan/LPS O-acetylase OafA/YrhL